MNIRPACAKTSAFTYAELWIVLVLIAFFIVIILSKIMHHHPAAHRSRCTANLKQVALGFNLWAQDHENRFPMEVSVSQGGTMEHTLAGNLLANFTIAANEFRTPAILLCPEDKTRKAAKDFSSLTINNVSYFLNADAAFTNQNHIIAGDRNLTSAGSTVNPGLLTVTNVTMVGWDQGLHDNGGDVVLVDGSAFQVTTKGLRGVLSVSATNHLLIP